MVYFHQDPPALNYARIVLYHKDSLKVKLIPLPDRPQNLEAL